ncbi:MAG TPA: TetR/AcrR family transcriptional regulator [Gemmatimonadaceae bacterium]|nr:TetR/AcrR family transcriptional regulator [Gemmatimonadaceae bacterium]
MPASTETRDRLIGVAMQLFWEKGYGATSIQDILLQAKVHAGSLYYAFPTKQELLLAVLERYRDGLYPVLVDPAWKGIKDPIDRIFALLASYRASLVATDCFYGCPIGSLALELHEPDPPVRDLLAENFNGWTRAIEQCLADAGSRLPKDVNRKELASFVLTTMEGGVMQARTHRSIHTFDAAVRRLRDYFSRLETAAATRRPARARTARAVSPRKHR